MALSYDNFTWRETAPGVWQRETDEAEKFYSTLVRLYEGSGRMHFAITGHVSLTVPVAENSSAQTTAAKLEQSLQAAWLRLRHEIPTIASQAAYDSGAGKWLKTYKTCPDESARSAWTKETFKLVSTGQTGEEWANSDPPAPKRATLFVVQPPHKSAASETEGVVTRDLVLRSPHDIIDGIGTLLLFNTLIKHAADAFAEESPLDNLPIIDGSETARLSPPYRVAANIPQSPTPTQQQRLDAMAAANSNPPVADDPNVTSIGIPYQSGSKLPGKHQRVASTTPADKASRLIAALKAADATVTHAFHAAIAMSMRDVQPKVPTERVRYINYILRNERAQCFPPFNSPAHAAAIYHSVPSNKLIVEMPATATQQMVDTQQLKQQRSKEFVRILGQMKEFYLEVRNDPEHYALAPYIWANATPPLPAAAFDEGGVLPVPEPNPNPSVSISSMGLVDNMIDSQQGLINAYNPWVTGEELGTGLGLFLSTFRGELCLSAAYNEAWHSKEEVQNFLTRCEDIVFGWLEGQVAAEK